MAVATHLSTVHRRWGDFAELGVPLSGVGAGQNRFAEPWVRFTGLKTELSELRDVSFSEGA